MLRHSNGESAMIFGKENDPDLYEGSLRDQNERHGRAFENRVLSINYDSKVKARG